MDALLLLIICQGIILFMTNGASSNRVVQLGRSLVIGKTIQMGSNIVNQYLGVPYAEPPVGNGRFKPTVPLKAFPEVLLAFNQPPACHQYTDRPFPWYFNDTLQSENCLFVNIWTPADASSRNPKPVLYYIPSGQFRLGSNTPSFYSGLILAGKDVIVVTVSYRLGSFGFLYTGTDEAPGNAGLWDILTGLKWVNDNIGYFGGDPSQITLSGQSSSAVLVGRISESKLARGLYSKLIMESGSPANLQTEFRDMDLKNAKELAKKVGCATDYQNIGDPDVNACLKRVSANELERAEYELAPHRPGFFYPIYGDEINPTNPRRDVFEGNFDCKPLLTGNVRDEGSIFLTISDSDYFGFYGEKNVSFTRETGLYVTDQLFELFPDLQSAMGCNDPDLDLKSMLENNQARVPDGDSYCLRQEVYTGFGDIDLLCPTVYFAEECAEQGNDVYYYFFVHRYSNTPFAPWMGVTHFSEVQFVFGLPFLYRGYYTEEDRQVSRQMIDYWTNFIKYGKPDPEWSKYSKYSPNYKVIGCEDATQKYWQCPRYTNCNNFRRAFREL